MFVGQMALQENWLLNKMCIKRPAPEDHNVDLQCMIEEWNLRCHKGSPLPGIDL